MVLPFGGPEIGRGVARAGEITGPAITSEPRLAGEGSAASTASRGRMRFEPARQGPVGRADEVHEGGDEQAADEQGVDEDGEAEPEAELGQFPGAEHERPEDQDHDAGRGRDDRAALGLAGGDRQVVAPAAVALLPWRHSSWMRLTR